MGSDYGTIKASKFAPKDVISSMPEKVITNILDRLPIQDAVKTGILSRNWRFRWTMVTQLVFDDKFFEYLLRTKGEHLFYRSNLSTILLHLKGFITKFVLYIPKDEYNVLDPKDINHWILFLSTKGMKEFILINMGKTPLKLPTHLFSCLELKHLILRNCCFPDHVPGFHGFPNILSFDFHLCKFGRRYTFGEFITQCPLLEILKLNRRSWNSKVMPFQIAKLENLKMLSLSLCELDNFATTSLDIFRLMGFLPKLQELDLDFQNCKFLTDAGARKRMSATMPCLKTLAIYGIDYNSRTMVFCACDLIHGSPNLQTLKITAAHEDCLSPPLSSWEVDCGVMDKLQLRIVELEGIRGSEIEICLIQSLLAYSSFLQKMVIKQRTAGFHENYTFAMKLLKLRRASSIAEIDLS